MFACIFAYYQLRILVILVVFKCKIHFKSTRFISSTSTPIFHQSSVRNTLFMIAQARPQVAKMKESAHAQLSLDISHSVGHYQSIRE